MFYKVWIHVIPTSVNSRGGQIRFGGHLPVKNSDGQLDYIRRQDVHMLFFFSMRLFENQQVRTMSGCMFLQIKYWGSHSEAPQLLHLASVYVCRCHRLFNSASFYKIKLNMFWILLARKKNQVMRINIFTVDLTDISAKKEALLYTGTVVLVAQSYPRYMPHHRILLAGTYAEVDVVVQCTAAVNSASLDGAIHQFWQADTVQSGYLWAKEHFRGQETFVCHVNRDRQPGLTMQGCELLDMLHRVGVHLRKLERDVFCGVAILLLDRSAQNQCFFFKI